ncbi:MAG: enolase C-terminal domain-like protein [Planctomycetota bacterium]|jgi:L-alanine-DL-glutamate epimerase-like enolase superfamily enzyme
MSKPTDIKIVATELYFLPVQTRVPLKFGTEALTSVTCARAKVTVEDASGRRTTGWGETPLSVQWVWPSDLPYEPRHAALRDFCGRLAEALTLTGLTGHPVEVGYDFIENHLHPLADEFNRTSSAGGDLPYLAALVCYSLFDIATHDAFGRLLGKDVYDTYTAEYLTRDLGAMLTPADGSDVSFEGRHIADYLVDEPPTRMRAWHLVGGLDPLTDDDLTGDEPDDGYPVTLPQWIETDSLTCLKIKLRGNDEDWDYDRFVRIGQIAAGRGVEWLSADFNCTVTDPEYVNRILDKLRDLHPRLYGSILYVEQPFPHDLEANRIDVHSVSARKPLFLDESAHDWKFIKLGRSLGWNGVALKTCKTQTGALLSLCWAKAHGMPLMVQDLTNPMLAQIPHLRLAAHAGTIMGVETNAPQFYPEASNAEAALHPGMYQRRQGVIDTSTLGGPGFGYREEEIDRELPMPAVSFNAST